MQYTVVTLFGGREHLVRAGGGPADGGLSQLVTCCGRRLDDHNYQELPNREATCKRCIQARGVDFCGDRR